MASGIDCGKFTKDIEIAVDKHNYAFYTEVISQIGKLIGFDSDIERILPGNTKLEKAAKDAWTKMRDNITSLMMLNGSVIGYDIYSPADYLNTIRDIIQTYFKIYGHANTIFLKANPRRILAISKIVNKVVNMQRNRWGKKLNIWERAIAPATLFGMRIDPLGTIHKFIKDSTTLLEDAKRSSSPYKARYNQINSNFIQSVRNAINDVYTTNGYVPQRVVMDGVADMKTKSGRTVIYKGSVKQADGTIKHSVIDQATEEHLLLDENEISDSDIREGLANKYTFELVNDIMHGQARYVKWGNDIPPEDHLEYIKGAILKLKDKQTLDPDDAKKGIKEIHTTTYDGIQYDYILVPNRVKYGTGKNARYMFKDNAETYYAYIIKHKDLESGQVAYYYYIDPKGNIHKSNNRRWHSIDMLRKNSRNPFRDGFYKSNEYRRYGFRYNRDAKGKKKLDRSSYEKDFNFSNLHQTWMTNQPDIDIIHSKVMSAGGGRLASTDVRIQSSTLWETIRKQRDMYEQIGKEMLVDFVGPEEEKIKEWFDIDKDGMSNIQRALAKHLGKDATEMTNIIKLLRDLFDVHKRFWYDKNGNIHTPNSHFMMMNDNYAPVLYWEEKVNQMLTTAIDEIGARRELYDEGSAEYEDLTKQMLNLELTQAKMANDKRKEQEIAQQLGLDTELANQREVIAQRTAYTRHRSDWTDIALRRKDALAHADYLDNLFYSLHRNKFMLELLETLANVSKISDNKSEFMNMTSYLINRTKIAMHDPEAYAGIGKFNYSMTKVADWLNKIPGKREWDAESAQRFVRFTKSIFSMALLGASGAMRNRTQSVNVYIGAGWHYTKLGFRIIDGKEENDFPIEKVNAIIDNTGIDEVTNMFQDWFAQGGNIGLSDAMLIAIPGVPFQIPTPAIKDFLHMLKYDRKKFVDNGLPEFDKMLHRVDIERVRRAKYNLSQLETMTEEVMQGLKTNKDKRKLQRQLALYKKEEKILKSEVQRRNVRELRKLLLDLITTPKEDNKYDIIRSRYLKLVGRVAEDKVKRAVAWKLSWWWDGFAPALFTFTEGERKMRRHAAIVALLLARDTGVLGGSKKTIRTKAKNKSGQDVDINVEEMFMTDDAVRIARNAVANTMFGMSPIHLGEASSGFGEHVGLYKAYPVQQMIHDWHIIESYMAGNVHKTEALTRLYTVAAGMAKRAWNGVKYNPKDDSLDHEAIKMIRFLGSRTAVSMAGATIEGLGIFRFLFRTPMAQQMSSIIRGGENPAMAIGFRLLMNALIFSSYDDKDMFEGNMIEVGWDILRLFLPVFLTLPANMIYDWFN